MLLQQDSGFNRLEAIEGRLGVFLKSQMYVGFLILGSILEILSYQSLEPVIVMMIFLLLGVCVLKLPILGGPIERMGFRLTFSIGWLVAGIAAFYLRLLNDPDQLYLDSSWFFEVSTRAESLGSLDEIRNLSSGAAAIWFWHFIYDSLNTLGFQKERYIGVLVNSMCVSFSCVLSIKMVRLLYGNDLGRIQRLILMFAFCGLFWLFIGIHVRDSFVLLGITAMSLAWTWFLIEPRFKKLIVLISLSGFSFFFFRYLRTEFVFVPIAMLLSGIVAYLGFKSTRMRKELKFLVGTCSVAAFGLVTLTFHSEIFDTLLYSYQSYLQGSLNTSSSDSLGMQLIVQQPLPLRILFGSVYLYISPIPIWYGFQFNSAYHFFVSCNGLFLYFMLPLVVLALWKLYRNQNLRTPALMFQLLIAAGFTIVVAGTSLESRHFAPFYPSLFLVSLIPNLDQSTERKTYQTWLILFFCSMAFLHFAWLLLKLLKS